jgi:hypothetical protein
MRIGVRAKIATLGLAEYVILKLIFVRALIILPFYLLLSVGYFLGTYLFFFGLFNKWKAKPSKPFTAFRFEVKERYKEFSDVYYKREQND